MAFARFEELNAREIRSLLTQLLLRAPRRPGGPLWETAADLLPEIKDWQERPPVVGVGTAEREEGPPRVVLFTREEPIDTEALRERLEWDLKIETIVSGEIEAAARPAAGGDSVSGEGPGGSTGTLGCVVSNPAGDRLILGCNHTLAGVNQGTVEQDAILQPGAADGGDPAGDRVGTLVDYRTITLGGYFENEMDAAIAELASPGDVEPGVRGIGAIQGVAAPLRHEERVQKVGWATGHTFGTYEIGASHTLTFPGVGEALFTDQYAIYGDDEETGFAQRGDSGAALLTEDSNELVGIVIGVSKRSKMAFASPIMPILGAFGVYPVT